MESSGETSVQELALVTILFRSVPLACSVLEAEAIVELELALDRTTPGDSKKVTVGTGRDLGMCGTESLE